MNLSNIHHQPSRLFILILNLITTLGSLILFGVGVYGLTGNTRLLLESIFISWTLIVLSLVILLASILGAAAGVAESMRIVGRYVILLSILVALQLGFLIYGFIRQDKVDVLLDGAWQNAYETNPRSLQDIETRLQCCGYATVDDRAIPKDSKDACLLSPAFGYKISCKDQLRDSYLNHESAVMGVVAATEVLQVLALIATASLLNKIPHDGNVDFQRRNEHSRALLRGMCEEDRDLDPAVQSPSSDAAHDNGGSSRYGSITTPR